MAEMKSEMPLFIQGMYATVLGVSFYKIALQDADAWKPVENLDELKFFIFNFGSFISSVSVFKFILFGFTLLILAHDWYTYHIEKKEKSKENYWRYLPQVFSLFFLAQMFASIEILNLKFWYIFAFGYTIANIFNMLVTYPKKYWRNKMIKYIIHIITTIVFFWVPNKFQANWYYIAFVITVASVTYSWHMKFKHTEEEENSNEQSIVEKKVENTNVEEAIITAQDEAKTARGNYLNSIKVEIEEAKITAAEEKITAAEAKAKEERKKIAEDLVIANEIINSLKIQLSNLQEKASKG